MARANQKLLHDWTQTIVDRSVLFVRPGALWHADVVTELPDGPVLVVFDDAHQIPSLVESVALLVSEVRNQRDIKLVVATRLCGADQIRAALTRHFASDQIRAILLTPLTIDDRRRLAEEVLLPVHLHLRDHLVGVAGRSPLVLVVAGLLIASGTVDPATLLSAQRFRDEILDRFVPELATESAFTEGRATVSDWVPVAKAVTGWDPNS